MAQPAVLSAVFLIAVLAVFATGLGATLHFVRRRGRAMEGAATIAALREEVERLRAAASGRDKAEAASEAKSRFLATVSHEIRTPLNGILGLAQLLKLTRLEAEQASYVEAIGDCARALGRLVDDILDFSKIEAGRLDLRSEAFELAPLIESVVELLAPKAHAKKLEIASFISREAPASLVGDEARLRQVLLNLLGNAVNFTQGGGVGLRVEMASPGRLQFSVEDTGPGVPAAAQKLIFEEFEQGDGSTTRKDGGAGLGLAISRRLVDGMGGVLALERSSSSGSIFAFTLPVDAAKQEAGPSPLRGRRALVVARTRFEGPYLARYLAEAGAAVDLVACDEVQALLAGADHDEIFVDCGLGEAAAREIAALARETSSARLFLMFSPRERHAFGEAALPQFDGWLVKPIRAASLIERLRRLPSETGDKRGARGESPSASLPVGQSLAGLRALVAEDNEINALIATRQLQALGAAPTRAEDGARAVDLAEAALSSDKPFGVILMDLYMPRLDGLEAVRRIRRAEAKAGAAPTPIIALTASVLEEDAQLAKAAGVDAVLTKPFDYADSRQDDSRRMRRAASKRRQRCTNLKAQRRHKTFVAK